MRIYPSGRLATILAVFVILSGCMTVSDRQELVPNADARATFGNRTLAVLPVKAQTSLAPDSVTGVRNEINKKLTPVLKSKLPSSHITDVTTVTNQLNVKNAMGNLQQFFATYEGTGVVDARLASEIGRALTSDFLVFSRLKAEKLDVLLSQGLGTSLEVTIIKASNGEIVWSGSGEWKKGGMFGLGRAAPDVVATNLIHLTLESL